MTRPQHRKDKREPGEYAPTTIRVSLPLLEAVRAACPSARDWSDSDVASACIGLVLQQAVPRTGLVHTE